MNITMTKNVVSVMRKEQCKCQCGNFANLQYINQKGRIKDSFTKVLNVPVYVCDCNFSFSDGSDCIQFARQVKKGVELELDEIEFGD